jgi:hypothetical protein
MARKKEGGMRQSALRLPPDLHQRLRRAGGEDGMGAEIRRRLEASFAAEKAPANPKTQELLAEISYFADETATYCGNWFDDAFAFEVLKESVESLLASARPKGDAVINPDRSALLDLTLGSDLSPKDISRIFVSDVMRARAKRADEGKRR